LEILFVDAPGGPLPSDLVPSELVETLRACRPLQIISVSSGCRNMDARRLAALSKLGPIHLVNRPDQVIDAGLATAATRRYGSVLALNEVVVFYAGLLANLLGLRANPPETLLAVRHKNHQRRLLIEAGVPSPAGQTVRTAEDLAACANLKFPVILKPCTGVGSLCVFRAADPNELAQVYPQALLRYEADPRPNGALPVFLVEEEIAGINWHRDPGFGYRVSVESLVHEGAIHHLGVTDKLPLASPFREVGGIMPSLLAADDIRRLEAVAADAIRAIGLTTGAVHTELMLTADGPVVIEVNGRIGGAVYELMKLTTGYDTVLAIADTARGRMPSLPGAATKYAAFVKPQPPQGRFAVTAIDETAFGQAMALAEWGHLDKSEGAVIDSDSGTNTNLARFIVTASTRAELFEKIDRVTSAVTSCVKLDTSREHE
jgi:biotin carboxylase